MRFRSLLWALGLFLCLGTLPEQTRAEPKKASARSEAKKKRSKRRGKSRAAQSDASSRRKKRRREAEAKPDKSNARAPSAAAQAAAAAAKGDGQGEIVKEGDTSVKVMSFSGLDIEGRLRSPQLLYFENRVRAEFDRPKLPHRSFMPELSRSTRESPVR